MNTDPNQPKREPWEALPCPFCGVAARIVGDRVYCNHDSHCLITAQIVYDFQLTKWNRRALDTATADLQQKVRDLQTHLLFQADALRSPLDVYEVVRRDTLAQLRGDLATLAERFNTTPEHAVMVATAFATTTDGVLNGLRAELAALREENERLRRLRHGDSEQLRTLQQSVEALFIALRDAISTYGEKPEIVVTEERVEAWKTVLESSRP